MGEAQLLTPAVAGGALVGSWGIGRVFVSRVSHWYHMTLQAFKPNQSFHSGLQSTGAFLLPESINQYSVVLSRVQYPSESQRKQSHPTEAAHLNTLGLLTTGLNT